MNDIVNIITSIIINIIINIIAISRFLVNYQFNSLLINY
jgi:hypothetical protein